MNKAIVYIEEMDSVADVTFPAVPQVVSLLMYDDTAKTKEKPHPPNGYPVVCMTVSVILLLIWGATHTALRIDLVFHLATVPSSLAGLQSKVP